MGCHFLLQGVFQTQGSNPCAGSRRTKRSQKELPHVRGQGHRPRVPGCDGAAMAERSYPPSKVSGGREETPCVLGQGRPGEATLRPRPGAAAGRSNRRSGCCEGAGGPRGAIPTSIGNSFFFVFFIGNSYSGLLNISFPVLLGYH